MSIILHDFSKEDWDIIRPQYSLGPYIGGSEASSVAGCSSFTGAYTLMRRKLGEEEHPDISGQLNVQRGHSFEPISLDEVEKTLGVKIFKPNYMLLNTEFEWAIADFDGVTADGWIVEAKTTSSMNIIESAKQGEVTPHYMCQGDHYLTFTQFKGCPEPGEYFKGIIFAIMHHVHRPPILIHVPREDRITGMQVLMLAESKFIDMFNRGELPDADGSESTTDSLKDKYDMGTKVVPPTPEQLVLHGQYKEASAVIKVQDQVKRKARNKLRELMGSEIQKVLGVCSISTRESISKKLLQEKVEAQGWHELIRDSTTNYETFRII